MSLLIFMTAAGAAFLAGPETTLQPEDLAPLGIELSVTDMEREHLHPYPLFLFEIALDGFTECDSPAANLDVFNEQGQLLFGSQGFPSPGFGRVV